MTREQFIERCRAMHEAEYAIHRELSDEGNLAAWRQFQQLVSATAQEMIRMSWKASEYFEAYAALENLMPENQLSGAISGYDQVATGLNWCYFMLGHVFYNTNEELEAYEP